jgi:C4-dicarboxylate-specific signal transduction histidine kinase
MTGPGGTIAAVIDSVRFATLARVLARQAQTAELLPHLHEYAVETAGGRCSVLLQTNPRTALLHPTSAFGLEYLPTSPWMTSEAEARLSAALEDDQAQVVSDLEKRFPALASNLGTRHAILLPLVGMEDRLGLLVVGTDTDPSGRDVTSLMTPVADAFVLAIERMRLQRDADLQRDLREVMHDFSHRVSSALNLTAGLEIFCDRATRLFGADSTSVWLHDRRARALALDASSDPGSVAHGSRVSTEDHAHPAALAMRSDNAQIFEPSGADALTGAPTVAVGLKGRRRALGTVVFEGMRIEPGGEADLLARAEEVGRHLSAAIENTQLLEQVLQSRLELENTFNSLADLVAVCDKTLHLVHVNQAFATRVGVPRHAIVYRSLRDFMGPAVTDWLAELTGDRGSVRGQRSVSGQGSVVGQGSVSGQKSPNAPVTREVEDTVLGGAFAITVTPLVTDEDSTGVVVVARDITRQSKLEAERTELRDRLTQSEKLAALGQFVAGIAHEMNNPLQAVLGHLELLRTTGELPPRLKRDVQTIFREADRAAKIVRNLLVFAGSRKLARRRLSLNLLVTRVLALRGPTCRAAGIEVVRSIDESLPRLVGDPLMLQQVLLNIILNAEQAVTGRAGARIEVRTRFDAAKGLVSVDVEDNGAGISTDVLPRVFEPFFTTKEVGKGTGLGLAIAYGIVQDHGGQIQVSNRLGGGAVFTIELPVPRG